ncbi:MAG: hypothetical protein FJ178_01565 [Gammaproteobacteria bacterium]|nr:hypothetical protein [Gammaproteobacteria bacterium]
MTRRAAMGAIASAVTTMSGSVVFATETPARSKLGLVAYNCGIRRKWMQQRDSKFDLFEPLTFLKHCHGVGAGGMQTSLGLKGITTQRADGQWLIESGDLMLYDAQFARYQAAKGHRAMEVLKADVIHYDDWDLRSPTAMNARADIHVAAFREFVKRRFSDNDCQQFGFEKSKVEAFDVLNYLLNPP